MWQREGTLKQLSFTFIKVTKGFVIVAFVKRNDTINQQQSFTTACDPGKGML